MKRSIPTIVAVVCLICSFTFPTPQAWAVGGVADSVIIMEDMTWPRQEWLWRELIRSVGEQIERTDELIKIVGHADKVMPNVVGSVPDVMAPATDAIRLEKRADALSNAPRLYSLNSASVKIYDERNRVLPTYDAFGQPMRRDSARYKRFVLQEGMGARYKGAAEKKEAVDVKEAAVQRQALDRLKKAATAAEIAGLHVVISASKQRQDMAHQKLEQAKGELDAFNAQLQVEDARKAEADREWAQEVVDRMRAKALASYRTQTGAPDEPRGGD